MKHLVESTINEADDKIDRIVERHTEIKHSESVNRRSQATNQEKRLTSKTPDEIKSVMVENFRVISKKVKS